MTKLTDEIYRMIQRAAGLIQKAQRVVALTGAGISTPSGIPDFRSEGSGLWTRFDPMEVASLSAFRHHPDQFFQWLRPLVIRLISALPNPAHLALARLEQFGFIHTIITQNIDGLHFRAGSKNLLELHGTMNSMTCVRCYRQYSSTGLIDNYIEFGTIPRCSECNGILKPDVILFEEQLPVQTWMKAEQACKTCDLMLVVGTSLEVVPSARLPMKAIENNAFLIIVNKTPTYIDNRAAIAIHDDVARIIPMIESEVLGGKL